MNLCKENYKNFRIINKKYIKASLSLFAHYFLITKSLIDLESIFFLYENVGTNLLRTFFIFYVT